MYSFIIYTKELAYFKIVEIWCIFLVHCARANFHQDTQKVLQNPLFELMGTAGFSTHKHTKRVS